MDKKRRRGWMTAENLWKRKDEKVDYCHSKDDAVRKEARERARYHATKGAKEFEGD